MIVFVYLAIYLGIAIFIIGCILRALEYAKAPMHLRWELYPVPHEEPDRARHGGSYFEMSNWWSKPSHPNRVGELRIMIPEILFLKALWQHNRRLWIASFPFHFGLYMLTAAAVLAASAAGLTVFAPAVAAGALGGIVLSSSSVSGYGGAVLCVFGAFGLLWRRVSDPELKNYTRPADVLNLLFFIITVVALTAGWLWLPRTTTGASLATGFFTFATDVQVNAVLGAGLILGSALLAYIPFTHMAHFIAKYFTYHLVRWDDRPNLRGGQIESQVADFLAQRPTWSAAHIGADGKRSWGQIATSSPVAEVRK